jgi:Fe-Mn family superoxide dismutase
LIPTPINPPIVKNMKNLSRRDFIQASTLAVAGLSGLSLPFVAQAETPANKPTTLPAFIKSPLNPTGLYQTPPLPYPYEALEPYIDKETMRLHHDIHFESYTKGLNEALGELENARAKNDFKYLKHHEDQLAFHGSGYVLHALFFEQMAPSNPNGPSQTLKNRLSLHFGSFEAFQNHFFTAAMQVQGSGWAILGYQPMGQKLIILQAEKHQNLTQWGIIPVLAIDVWEHAYYLKYQNKRAEYVKNWWNIVDWQGLEVRLAQLN